MDHKEMLKINDDHVRAFVVNHIGNPQRLGRAMFKWEYDFLQKQCDEQVPAISDAECALRALSRASYQIGMYSVDHVNVLPHGACVKAMFGAFTCCVNIAITKRRSAFWKSISNSVGKNMN
jgi:hypothetical protein